MMKCLIVVLTAVVAAWGWVDEDGWDGAIPADPPPPETDAWTLTIIDEFQAPTAGHVLGLDHSDTPQPLFIMDNMGDNVRLVETGTGVELDAISWTPASFGVAVNTPMNYLYVNQFNTGGNDISRWDPVGGWTTAFANPAGDNGRGMEFWSPTNMIWQTDDASGVWRIDETGAGTFFTTPEVPTQMSGLAVFPLGANLGIVVTRYNAQTWYFYEFDGAALTYLGSASPGVASWNSSLGLAWDPLDDTFFWSYRRADNTRWIAEVQYSFTALERSTWGDIKAQF